MVIPANSRSSFLAEVDGKDFQAGCIFIAKQIDAYIGKNEVPLNVQDLAIFLNNACRHKCNDQSRAVVMMLMISVKNACQLGWFPQGKTRELLDIIDSMWNGFSSPENVTPSVNNPISLILQVIERFYPFLKLGKILVAFEAKPEANILAKDFQIPEEIIHSPKQMIGLLVVRTEDISKSNCIVHPQEVSFLLNGKGIDNRATISMDSGPQLPTNITALVNVGVNLLQTVGCFGGSYFIAIAYMDVIHLPDKPLLKDYVHSEVIESNSDCDIIEGASKISLSCPISRTRIKLPVKGHICKHLQCFDFWNYVNINMRRPSWRCPHCNQSACYTDIRVDQNMMKILEGVERNAAAVVISADGSWRVVSETDEDGELISETTRDQGNPNSFLNLGPAVLDLTRDENEMETSDGTHVDEQKPLSAIQGLSNNTPEPATNYYMLNQSSASINTLPQLPQTLDAFTGQQFMNLPQVVNTQDSAARQALPTSSPQTLNAFNGQQFRNLPQVVNTQDSAGRQALPTSSPQTLNASSGQQFMNLPQVLNTQDSAARRALPTASPQTLNSFNGQQFMNLPQELNTQDSAARQALPTSSPQHRFATNTSSLRTSMPVSQSSGSQAANSQFQGSQAAYSQFQGSHVACLQFQGQEAARSQYQRSHIQSSQFQGSHGASSQYQGSHVEPAPLGHSLSNSDLMERWRQIHGSFINENRLQNQRPYIRSISPQQQRPMPSPIIHPQNLAVNYGGTADQRPIQRSNPNGATRQISSRELSYLTSPNTENWRPQTRMRGSIAPGSTAYDHMIIRPTRPPVQPQAQTLPPPHPTAYNRTIDEIQIQAFLAQQSYHVGITNETQGGMDSLPVDEGFGLPGSLWSMPPNTW